MLFSSRTLLLAWMLTTLPAAAQWTVGSGTPQVIGQTQSVGTRHAIAATPDGATWLAWINAQCFGSLLVQRIGAEGQLLAPGGLTFDTQDDCTSLTAHIAPLPDGGVVTKAFGTTLALAPVHRLDAAGQDLWPSSFVTDNDFDGAVRRMHTLDNGDTLIAGRHTGALKVARYAIDGTPAWTPTPFDSSTGANMRIFGLQTDGAGGAYVIWDSPGAYTRRIRAQRLDALGAPAWSAPELLVDIPPGSSRHTDPVALADSQGGLALVWTQGAEQALTPVPARWQRLLDDGSIALDSAGARTSDSPLRQYAVQVSQGTPGGDLFIAWREGPLDDLSLRVQRVTLGGDRLFGSTGRLVTPLASANPSFAMEWLDAQTLAIAVADPGSANSVSVHRISDEGDVDPEVLTLSTDTTAVGINAVGQSDGLVVVWQETTSPGVNAILAQRINPDGSIGAADSDNDGVADSADNCLSASNAAQRDTDQDGYGNRCDADLNNDCIVNVSDLGLMRVAFFSAGPDADLDGDGTVNVVDLGLLRLAFFAAPGPSGLATAGCAN